MIIDGRRRLSRSSEDVQTLHSHPIVGTPTLVPEPRTVMETAPIIPLYFPPAGSRAPYSFPGSERSGIEVRSANFREAAVLRSRDLFSFYRPASPTDQWNAAPHESLASGDPSPRRNESDPCAAPLASSGIAPETQTSVREVESYFLGIQDSQLQTRPFASSLPSPSTEDPGTRRPERDCCYTVEFP